MVAVLNDVWPIDKDSPHSADMTKWRVKRESNDELRQKFIDRTVPQADFLGITMPDKELKWDEATQHYKFGEINWDEFQPGDQRTRAMQPRTY